MRHRIAVMLCALFLLPCTVCFASAETDAAYDYPATEVMTIDLFIHPSHYLQMISTEEDKKHPAVVCVDEGNPARIEVSLRGASSLDEGMSTPAKRVPLKLQFDETRPQDFVWENPTLKLINSSTPAILIVQYIAMQAFEYMGIPSPKLRPAFLRINGVDFGLYLAVEDVNDAFAQKHYGSSSLFRPSRDGREDDVRMVDGKPFSAKSDPEHVDLDALLREIAKGGNISQYTLIDNILRFFACETFLYNSDGVLRNEHNAYYCVHDGRVSMIPWDEDMSFQVFNTGIGESHVARTTDFEQSENVIARTLLQDETYYALYKNYIRELNEVFLNPDTFLPWLEETIHTLSPYLRRDPTILYPDGDIDAALTQGPYLYNGLEGNLLLTMRVYHDQLNAQLNDPNASFHTDGYAVAPDGFIESALRSKRYAGGRVVEQVCTNYWKLRRQFLWGNDSSIWFCGGMFAAVFAAAVAALRIPKGYSKQKKKVEYERDDSVSP